MRSGFKLILMTLPLVIAGAGFVAWTISSRPAPAQEGIRERAVSVRVITTRQTTLSPEATGFGLVAPARHFEAIAQVTGTAEYVNPALKQGEILEAGSELVRLSDSDYVLAIAQARANIRAAEAKLAEIAVSEENLKAGLAIEQQALEIREAELTRVERLYEAGTASRSALDNARAAWLAQRQKLQSQQNALALLPTQREVQKQQIAVYQASLATAELNLERTRLTLPFAARVSAVSVEVGQLVRSGQSVASLDGVQTAEVEAQISAEDLRRLFHRLSRTEAGEGAGEAVAEDERGAQGAEAAGSGQGEGREGGGTADGGLGSLALDPTAFTDRIGAMQIGASVRLRMGEDMLVWPARLDRFSSAIDPRSGTIGVIVQVDNAYGRAEPGTRPPLTRGMFVEVGLQAPPEPGILIPRAALRGSEVMVADADDRLRLVPVTVALEQGDLALITQGLEPGMRLVVSTPVPLVEGLLLAPQVDRALEARLRAAGVGE